MSPNSHMTAFLVALFCITPLSAMAERLDVGIYGSAWTEWVLDHPETFDFMIYQAGPMRSVQKIRSEMQRLSSIRVSTIVVIRIFVGEGRRTPSDDDVPQNYLLRITEVVDAVGARRARAYSLDEENIHWNRRAELLDSLYQVAKASFPEESWYQWYSGSRASNVPGKSWPAIGADGWIFDQYSMAESTYREYLSGMLELDLPLYSVVWASPGWHPDNRHSSSRDAWWENAGWKIFYSRLALNHSARIPTAFFAYSRTDDDRVQPLWASGSQCDREFLRFFIGQTIPYVKVLESISMPAPAVRPAWIPQRCGDADRTD